MEYIGYPIAFIGFVLAYLGIKMIYRKPNYEYEKTTDGKNTKFMTFDESEKHKRIKDFGKLLLVISIMIFGLGLYLVILSFLNP